MIILMIPAKGGVGNSLLTRFFALNRKADLLIDGAFGRRGQDLHHGVEDEILFDLFDYLSDSAEIQEARCQAKHYDLLLASQTRSLIEIAPEDFCDKIEELKNHYDAIFVDLSHWQVQYLRYWLRVADQIIIVAEDDVEAYRGIDQIEFLCWQEKLRPKIEILFNKVPSREVEAKIQNFVEEKELDLIGIVPKLEDTQEVKLYKLNEYTYSEEKRSFIDRLFRGVKND